MQRHTLKIFLPPLWRETREGSQRVLRPDGDGAGQVRLAVHPPELCDKTDGVGILAALNSLLVRIGMPSGITLHAGHGECMAGTMAYTLRKLPVGLMQFWLVPGPACVFATYQMGRLEKAQRELAEAHEIMQSIHWKTVDED